MIAVLCQVALAFDVGVGIRGDHADAIELSQFEVIAAQPLHPWLRTTAGIYARALPVKGPPLSIAATTLRDDEPMALSNELFGGMLGLALAPPWDPDRPAERIGARPMVFASGGAAYIVDYDYYLRTPMGRVTQSQGFHPAMQAGFGGEVALDPGLSVQASVGGRLAPHEDLRAVWTIDVVGRIPSR